MILPDDKKANPHCKDCLGRGYSRWMVKGEITERLCHCLKTKEKKEKKEN